MSNVEERVWPFPVPPREQLPAKHVVQVEFLEQAYREGFAPRVDGPYSCWMATGETRHGDIIRRSPDERDWWEVMLSETDRPRVATGFVFGFGRAADLVLRWLRGEDEESIWIALSAVATRRCRNDEFIDSGNPSRAGEPGFTTPP